MSLLRPCLALVGKGHNQLQEALHILCQNIDTKGLPRPLICAGNREQVHLDALPGLGRSSKIYHDAGIDGNTLALHHWQDHMYESHCFHCLWEHWMWTRLNKT